MDVINILTLYKSLFITYINSNIYILIDKCLLVSGYTLTTSSDKATVGLDFTFTCVTTQTLIAFCRDGSTVCIITGSNTDGTCALDHGYITNYAYTCNPTTNTYTVTIPGSYLTDILHRTRWCCENPFGGGQLSTKILYVNGEVFFSFFPFSFNYNSCKYYNLPGTCLSYCDHLYGVGHWAYLIKHYEAK
jgi:hypothetical protein